MSVSIQQMEADLRRLDAEARAGNQAAAQKAAVVAQRIREAKATPPPGEKAEFDPLQLPGINQLMRVTEGVTDLAVDPAIAAQKATGTPEDQQRALEYEAQRKAHGERLNPGGGMDWWRLGGSMAVPGGAGTKAAGKVLPRLLDSASTGAVLGAGGPAGPGQEEAAGMTPEEIAAATRKDIGVNAAVGGLASMIPPELVRTVANLGGGAVRYFQDMISAADKEGADAVKYAEKHLLDLMPDDVSRNKLSKTIGQYIDMIDPRSSRQKQINKAREHVEEIQQRNILDPNQDPQNIIKRSMTEKDQILRAKDNMNYETVYAKTDTLPNGQPRYIDDRSIRNVAMSMWEDLQHGIPELQGTQLENIASRMVDTDPKTFRQWDSIRSDLFNQADVRRMQGDYKSAGILDSMAIRVTNELDDTAKLMGDDVYKDWRKARKFHEESVIPNREGVVGRAVRQRDAEAFVGELIGSSNIRGRDSRAYQLWNALDQEGRQAARQTLMDEVMRLGTDKAQETGFSPAKAATAIENLQTRIDAFFPEPEAEQMRGLANYLRFMSRSTMMAGSSGTGMSLGAGVLGGIGYGATQDEEGGAAGPIGAGVLTYFLMRSPQGRQLLQKMARSTPGDEQFMRLNDQMENLLQKGGFSLAVGAPRAMDQQQGGGW